ncbi:MAG: S-adenosylmethionine decarboxylase [Parcubacteria group bacterium]|jgi:S-adenosylmethionine decarboxylase
MKSLIQEAFGPHLTLNGGGCGYEQIASMESIHTFLDKCPGLIHMTKIMHPAVFRNKGVTPKLWGWSGIVIIAESHISVHTIPNRRILCLDIFSCKPFGHELAINIVTKHFNISWYSANLTNRGLEFPRDEYAIERCMRQEYRQMQINT